jgi:hypothetical protein
MGTSVPATVVIGNRPRACFIENISLAGALLRFPRRAPKAGEVRLESGSTGLLNGRCAWSRGRHMGLDIGLCQRSVALTLNCICELAPLAGQRPAGRAEAAIG